MKYMTKTAALGLACSLLLAACGKQPVPPTEGSGTSAANASEAAPASTNDPNAINEPIPAEAYNVSLALDGAPTLNTDSSSLSLKVQVKNEGKAAIYGVGSKPVNIGGMIVGAGDSIDGEGGLRDFVRAPLPLIAAGESAVVSVDVPADPRLNGRIFRLATVQEAVGWHDDKATVDIGPFEVLEGKYVSVPKSK